MSVTITGVNRLNAKLRRLPELTRLAVSEELERAARDIETDARARAPVDTGRLRASITHEIREDGLSAIIGTDVPYAPYIEFGTRRAPAQPFLFPAYENIRHRLAQRLARAIEQVYRKI